MVMRAIKSKLTGKEQVSFAKMLNSFLVGLFLSPTGHPLLTQVNFLMGAVLGFDSSVEI